MTSEMIPVGAEPSMPFGRPTSEREALVGFLDFYRAVLIRKAAGLSPADLDRTTSSSNLTLGALVKHMALVEDSWFTYRLAGQDAPEPWASAPFDDDPDWEITTSAQDTPVELLALFDAACDRSRAIVEAAESLDIETVLPDDDPDRVRNLRWILIHMIEEYARHVGHADFLRESIDGSVGD